VLVDNSDVGELRDFAVPKNMRVISAGRNLGFAAGNNLALAECQSEFFAALNPDAYLQPEWLERMVDSALHHAEAAAFGSLQLQADAPDTIDGIGDRYHFSGVFRREQHGKKRAQSDLCARDIFSPCAAAALYRAAALKNIGGFDEDFFCYGEDVDVGFRLRLAGHKCRFVPEAIVLHAGGTSSGGQRSGFAAYHGHRNMVWVYVKNMPGCLFWLLLPLHISANIASLLVLTLRGQGKVAWRAKREAINGLLAMWKKRRAIQTKRVASINDTWRALSWRL
jgi:GT2 family glycosyltransferase